jgi:hypothetical protein
VKIVPLILACSLVVLQGEEPNKSPIEKISADEYKIGLVHLDARKRQIDFPAQVNMREGPIEYFLVHIHGKLHESIFKTEAQPYHIHLAALLLNPAAGDQLPKIAEAANKSAEKPSAPILKPNTNVVEKGTLIEVTVWFSDPAPKIVHAESLVMDMARGRAMREGPWMYNGSRIVEGTFLAQRDGSILAMIADPDSLADNPGPRRDDDDNWQPLAANLPPIGTKVTIQMRFLKKEEQVQ